MKTSSRGFTLTELLVVLGIMAILVSISIPMISSMVGTGSVDQAVSGISLTLNQARAYAMAHNTYVWVGFDQPSTTLTIGVVAGTTGSANDLTQAPPSYTPIARRQTYPNFNITTVNSIKSSNSSSSLTTALPDGTDLLTSSLSGFTENVGSSQIQFKPSATGAILQFDPEGKALISPGALTHWIQFGLQPIKGSHPNVAIIQVAGLSGQVQVFRP